MLKRFKSTIITILMVFIAITSLWTEELGDFVPGKITICFSADLVGNTRGEMNIQVVDGIVVTSYEWLNVLAQEYQITNLERKYWVKNQEWNLNGKYPMNIFQIETDDYTRSDELLNTLKSNNAILFAEKVPIYESFYMPNDPLISQQWALEKIQAFDAWDIETGSSDIIIGIVDSGVKWNHEDLQNNIWINEAELPGITINWTTGEITGGDCPDPGHKSGIDCPGDNDGNGYCDDVLGWDFRSTVDGGESNNPFQDGKGYDHGTAISGLVAAVGDNSAGIVGVAYTSKILNTKHSPFGSRPYVLYSLEKGVYYMTDIGVHIINCSWGAPLPLSVANDITMAVQYAVDHGVLVIAASGNSSCDMIYTPAILDDVFTVTGTDRDDYKYGNSTYGFHVDISAPSAGIFSTIHDEDPNKLYGLLIPGTSVAAPIVAGVAALALSLNPDLTADQIKQLLKETSDPVNHMYPGDDLHSNPGFEGQLGAGRVNALNSLLSILGKFEKITEDTIFAYANMDLDKKYIIDGVTLILEDIIMNPNSDANLNKFLGFEIRNSGMLIISGNSTVDLGSGFIKVMDDGSSVYVQYGSQLKVTGGKIDVSGSQSTIEINENSLLKATNSTIDLTNGAKMSFTMNSTLGLNENSIFRLSDKSSLSFDASVFDVLDSDIELEGRSKIDFTDQSFWGTAGVVNIIGNTSFGSPGRAPLEFDPYLPPAVLLMPGDRITVNNSLVWFSQETVIDSGSENRWDGFYFVNCRPETHSIPVVSHFSGSVNNVHYITIHDSEIAFFDFSMTNSGRLSVANSSQVYMGRFHYENNSQSLFVGGGNSSILLHGDSSDPDYRSTVSGNLTSSGLTIQHTTGNNVLAGVSISQNGQSGIDITSAKVTLKNVDIFQNEHWGITSLSQSQSIISSNVKIYDNGYTELVAMGNAFPLFTISNPADVRPIINDEEIFDDTAADHFLLMAIGQIPSYKISTGALVTAISDTTRFYPSHTDFQFDANMPSIPEYLYETAINSILNDEYEEAYGLIMEIMSDHLDSEYASPALYQLPYLVEAMNGDLNDLLDFVQGLFEELTGDGDDEGGGLVSGSIGIALIDVEAHLSISLQLFNEAISLYAVLLQNPSHDMEQLLFELNQAFAYYLAVINSESRALPIESVHKPTNYVEYREIANNIYDRILNIRNAETKDETPEIAPEIFTIDLQNYPNPFNPETMIHFTNPIAGNVTLEIYNIRGQKVKTLVNEDMIAGHHQTVWNGQNESNQSVASGIYLYRLQAGGEQIVRRMVLLK